MKTPALWLRYYQENRHNLLEIPWDRGAELTTQEAAAVASSVQEFQVGESSEGHHLLQDARAYSIRAGDGYYAETIPLFIAEEQRHARDLARFLKLNSIPLVKTTLVDRIFRQLRNLFPGLELSVGVLVTAEIIAKVYYAALRDATESTILRRLCEQILHDEVSHIAFQTEQLARLRARRNAFSYSGTMVLQRLLMLSAIVVVWLSHAPVMRRAGMSATDWWRHCWCEFDEAFSESTRAEAQKASQERALRTAFALTS